MKRILLLGLVVVFLSGCKDVGVRVDSEKNEVGRYQIINSDVGPFLVDSVSGDSWKYGRITMKNGDLWESGWFGVSRMSEAAVSNSFSRMEEYEAEQKK